MVVPRHPTVVGKTLLFLAISIFLIFADGTANPINPYTNTDASFSANANCNSNSNSKILSDVTEAIGETPLVDLSRVVAHYGMEPPTDGRILAKLEYLSPGASKKDRIARTIIKQARANGTLKPGQTVVELTSGNTGTGLAIVCGILGHPFVAVMSRGNSRERSKMMEALGATVVLVDQVDPQRSTEGGGVSGADLDLVELRAQQITESLNAFRVDQFLKGANALAHYEGTGPELWRDSGGTITDFLDFVGTGGSFGGIASYLKEQSGGTIRCYIVEPEDAVVLGTVKPKPAPSGEIETESSVVVDVSSSSSLPSGCHRIQGGGYMKSSDELPLIAPLPSIALQTNQATSATTTTTVKPDEDIHSNAWIDGYFTVTDEEAIQATRDLAKYEGIFAGYSAGANLIAAIKLLQHRKKERRANKGQTATTQWRSPDVVAILICDSGLKYMSTDLWK